MPLDAQVPQVRHCMVGRAKMTVSVSKVEGLPLFIEGGERPLQVLRVELAGLEGQIARVSAVGLQGGPGPWVDVVLAEHVQALSPRGTICGERWTSRRCRDRPV